MLYAGEAAHTYLSVCVCVHVCMYTYTCVCMCVPEHEELSCESD